LIRAALLVLAGCGRFGFGADDVADAAPACAHTFCDDFERTSVQGDWTSSVVTGGTLSIDNGVLVADLAAPTNGLVFLSKDLDVVATSSIHLEVDVEFTAGTDGEIDLVQIRWLDLPGTCTGFGYFLVRDQTGPVVIQETYVNCGGPASNNDNLASFPSTAPSGVQHVAIDVTLGDLGVAHIRTQIGNTLDLDKQLTSYAVPASHLNLQLGTPGDISATAPWQVRYDNFVIDVR
jgi:hypothetical protein